MIALNQQFWYVLEFPVFICSAHDSEANKHFPLTKGLLGPHQAESEGYAPRLLFYHLGHLIVPTPDNALVIDGLDVVTNTYRLQAVYGAVFLYSLAKKTDSLNSFTWE